LKIDMLVAELFHTDGWSDGQTWQS